MKKLPLMRRIKNIHFVGIGGTGMNGIAEVLLNQGYRVTGSDQKLNFATARLASLGAEIFEGHDIENIKNADAVVISTAINSSNPEVSEALKNNIPVLPRAQMLAELMRFNYGIAIAGTHGKTTTTSLVASILAEADLDPTFVIGGVLNSSSASARLGAGKYFVVEADESDASFLYFNPMVSVVTNIDADHMQTYDNDFGKLKLAFTNFLHRLPFYGLAVVCIDDMVIQEILPDISRPVITYGVSENANVRMFDFVQDGFASSFKIDWPQNNLQMEIKLNLPGKHNALNALAAIIVAVECCGVSEEIINAALSKFEGVGRRVQRHGELPMPSGKVLLIDDYGHHPKEVDVTLKALREVYPDRRLVLAFQPHRYSRTKELFEDFASALSEPDELLLMEIYPAGEEPIVGIDSRSLIRNIRQRGKVEPVFVSDIDDILNLLPNILRDGDVLLMQGAGTIGTLPGRLKEEFGDE